MGGVGANDSEFRYITYRKGLMPAAARSRCLGIDCGSRCGHGRCGDGRHRRLLDRPLNGVDCLQHVVDLGAIQLELKDRGRRGCLSVPERHFDDGGRLTVIGNAARRGLDVDAPAELLEGRLPR